MTTTGFMTRTRMTLLSALGVWLAACNGSGTTAGIEGTGSPSPAAAQGPITGFGSIFVGGVEYNTSGAQIMIDDQPGAESQLRAGQIVTLQGTVNSDGVTGTATQVVFSGDVQGPVTHIDTTNNTFVVLGQTVQITGSTVFDDNIQPADITGLSTATSFVEVSGFTNAAGVIEASRVDLQPATGGLQVKGAVQNLNLVTHTFQINGVTVDYSGTNVSTSLANGSSVQVRASSVSSGGALVATRVEAAPGVAATAKQHADINGIITTFTSSASFVVNGVHVTTDANTQLNLHGATLASNVKVHVVGQFDSSGNLVAKQVEAQPDSLAHVAGLVDAVTASSNTLSVLGVSIVVSSSTSLEDRSSQHLRQFRVSDLHVGDYVEVDGIESNGTSVAATVLERKNNGNKSVLQGTAHNVFTPNFVILGVTVHTDSNTVFQGGVTSSAFFAQANGHVVQVTGSFSGTLFTAAQVKIVQ
jgi:hypothetical protein